MDVSNPKRCLGCGYILAGLPEPRCPECGRGFDPADPASYGPRPPWGWPNWVTWSIIAGAAIILPPAVATARGTWDVPYTLVGVAVNVIVFIRSLLGVVGKREADARLAWTLILLVSFAHAVVAGGCIAVMQPLWSSPGN